MCFLLPRNFTSLILAWSIHLSLIQVVFHLQTHTRVQISGKSSTALECCSSFSWQAVAHFWYLLIMFHQKRWIYMAATSSRHHVKTILFRRIRHSKSHFPRLLQRNLHARQLLWMLFLAALQHTKTSKAGVTVWTRSQKDSFTEAAWKHCDSEAPMLPMLLVGVWS